MFPCKALPKLLHRRAEFSAEDQCYLIGTVVAGCNFFCVCEDRQPVNLGEEWVAYARQRNLRALITSLLVIMCKQEHRRPKSRSSHLPHFPLASPLMNNPLTT